MVTLVLAASQLIQPNFGQIVPAVPPLQITQSESRSVAQWDRREIGETGMSAELPGMATSGNLPVRENVQRVLVKSPSYSVAGKGFAIIFSYSEFQANLEVNLQKAADGAVSSLKLQKGISDANLKTREGRQSGLPAVFVDGSYKLGGREYGYRAVFAGTQNRMWQVNANYLPSDTLAITSVKRVFDSLQIKSK